MPELTSFSDVLSGSRVVVKDHLCSRFRASRSSCALCIASCPKGAISLDGQVLTLDSNACNSCGVCHSICPNGAFEIKGFDDSWYSARIAEKAPDSSFRFSCAFGARDAHLLVPCLSRLTEALVLEPLARGFGAVEILCPDCTACDFGGAEGHRKAVLERASLFARMVGLDSGRILLRETPFVPTPSTLVSDPPVSRRALFGILGRDVLASARTAVSPQEAGDLLTDGEKFRKGIEKKEESAKRVHLRSLLRSFSQRDSIQVGSQGGFLWDLAVSSRCLGCNVCEQLCPTSAIVREEDEKTFRLVFSPDRCTACGICVDSCLPRAIRPKETLDLSLLAGDGTIELFSSSKQKCVLCRIDFLGDQEGLCNLCKTTNRKRETFAKKWLGKGTCDAASE